MSPLGLSHATFFCENAATLSQLGLPKNDRVGVSGKGRAISRAFIWGVMGCRAELAKKHSEWITSEWFSELLLVAFGFLWVLKIYDAL